MPPDRASAVPWKFRRDGMRIAKSLRGGRDAPAFSRNGCAYLASSPPPDSFRPQPTAAAAGSLISGLFSLAAPLHNQRAQRHRGS